MDLWDTARDVTWMNQARRDGSARATACQPAAAASESRHVCGTPTPFADKHFVQPCLSHTVTLLRAADPPRIKNGECSPNKNILKLRRRARSIQFHHNNSPRRSESCKIAFLFRAKTQPILRGQTRFS